MTTEPAHAATIFTDPATVKPPPWTAPFRAAWPIVSAIAIAACIYFFVAPRIGGYGSDLLIDCGIAIIMAVSLTVVNGFTGQFSIGHAGFMSLGGYLAAALVYYGSYRWFGDFNFHGGILSSTGGAAPSHAIITQGDLLFIAACLSGGIFAAACGWVVGLPSLRLRGDYLAIVTLGFGEIVRVIIQGTSDQLDTTTDPSVADISFPRQLTHLGGALGFSFQPVYSTNFWVWLVALCTIAATLRLKYSSYGRSLISIREDDVAAQAIGVNITRLKVRAFVYSAFFAGLGGGLYAMKLGSTINAGEFGFQRSFDYVIMVVLGGLGSVSGAVIAAIIVTLLPELLRNPPGLWPWGLVIAAIVAALIVALAPRRRGPLITLISLCVIWEIVRWIARLKHVDLSQYRMVIYALALIIMMIVRPQGLFGIHEIWDYLPRRWQWWHRQIDTPEAA